MFEPFTLAAFGIMWELSLMVWLGVMAILIGGTHYNVARRGVEGTPREMMIVAAWTGIFFPVLSLAALVWSCVAMPKPLDEGTRPEILASLSELDKLVQDGTITQAQHRALKHDCLTRLLSS